MLHPQVNDTGMKPAEAGRVAAMGDRPPPSLAAAPAPAPPPAEAAPAAPPVFSPDKLPGGLPGEGLTNAARSGSGKGRPSQRWPVAALRGCSGLRARGAGRSPGGYEGAEPATAARRAAAWQVSAATARGSPVLRGSSPNWRRSYTVWVFPLEVNAWKYSLSPLQKATWISSPP